jgi:hypothetical protein
MPDRVVATDQEVTEGLDHLAGRIRAGVPLQQHHPRRRDVERQAQQRRHQQARSEKSKSSGFMVYIATSSTMIEIAMLKVKEHVQGERRQRQHHHRQDHDDEQRRQHLARYSTGQENPAGSDCYSFRHPRIEFCRYGNLRSLLVALSGGRVPACSGKRIQLIHPGHHLGHSRIQRRRNLVADIGMAMQGTRQGRRFEQRHLIFASQIADALGDQIHALGHNHRGLHCLAVVFQRDSKMVGLVTTTSALGTSDIMRLRAISRC